VPLGIHRLRMTGAARIHHDDVVAVRATGRPDKGTAAREGTAKTRAAFLKHDRFQWRLRRVGVRIDFKGYVDHPWYRARRVKCARQRPQYGV